MYLASNREIFDPEDTMKIYGEFFRDETGAVTVDWVALTSGLLLLGIIIVYAIFNGGVSSLVGNINETLADVVTDVDVGSAWELNGIAVASSGASMELNGIAVASSGASMELFPWKRISVGSTVSVITDSLGTTKIAFTDPNNYVVHSGIFSGPVSDGLVALDGATVSSATTFALSDGSTISLR